MLRFSLVLLSIWFLNTTCTATTQPGTPVPAPWALNWYRLADTSTTVLIQDFYNMKGWYFNKANGGDTTFNYWPQAHALDVLTDAYLRTKNGMYVSLMNEWMGGVKRKNGNTFLNEYYDDMLWNALAMLRAYDATHEDKWLAATQTLWDDIKTGWNDTMGGGIAWRKGQRYYKNTPANAPAIILAARLYQHLHRPDDLAWAKKIYDWQKKTLVDPVSGLVYDGINDKNDGKLNTSWKFTYCQGVYIGGAHELYRITKDPVYMADAIKTATLSITDPTLTTNGLMRDEGDGDGGLFKAVLVRYLTQLILEPDLPGADKTRYATFLKHNAETLWQSGTARLVRTGPALLQPGVLFGPYWGKPPVGGKTQLTTQLSGTILLEAMALLNREHVF